jgi:hypothetical protein
MKKARWLMAIITLTNIFLFIVVLLNCYIDTYGIRTSLFSMDKKIGKLSFMEGINQHIFNTEYIYRHPDRFDSFLFGSSRTGIINLGKTSGNNFYNMSYNLGIPAEHLLIIKSFLKKGIKIKTVIIGLDEFSFSRTLQENENTLLRQMHPAITGKSLTSLFYLYYFRIPQLFELADGKDKLLSREQNKFALDNNGTNMSWFNAEQKIITSGKPIYFDKTIIYVPFNYDNLIVSEAFKNIEELILLSKKYRFNLIFFFNPVRSPIYLNYALALMPVKEKLASMTDFYDFSGFNAITNNNINYYDDSHYRYYVGNIIIGRIFNDRNIMASSDFGVLVTKYNVDRYNKKQKMEWEKYLAEVNRCQ